MPDARLREETEVNPYQYPYLNVLPNNTNLWSGSQTENDPEKIDLITKLFQPKLLPRVEEEKITTQYLIQELQESFKKMLEENLTRVESETSFRLSRLENKIAELKRNQTIQEERPESYENIQAILEESHKRLVNLEGKDEVLKQEFTELIHENISHIKIDPNVTANQISSLVDEKYSEIMQSLQLYSQQFELQKSKVNQENEKINQLLNGISARIDKIEMENFATKSSADNPFKTCQNLTNQLSTLNRDICLLKKENNQQETNRTKVIEGLYQNLKNEIQQSLQKKEFNNISETSISQEKIEKLLKDHSKKFQKEMEKYLQKRKIEETNQNNAFLKWLETEKNELRAKMDAFEEKIKGNREYAEEILKKFDGVDHREEISHILETSISQKNVEKLLEDHSKNLEKELKQKQKNALSNCLEIERKELRTKIDILEQRIKENREYVEKTNKEVTGLTYSYYSLGQNITKIFQKLDEKATKIENKCNSYLTEHSKELANLGKLIQTSSTAPSGLIHNKEFIQKFYDELKQIPKINDAEIKPTLNDEWASTDDLSEAMKTLYGDSVLILDPQLSSSNCIMEKSTKGEENSANWVAEIRELIKQDCKIQIEKDQELILKKPLIGVINTHAPDQKDLQKAGTKNQQSVNGGNHWIFFVVLPKNYTPISAENLQNENELIFFIDSLGLYKIPQHFYSTLTEGKEVNQTLDDDPKNKHIKCVCAAFPEAVLVKHEQIKQQKGGSDCGWWTLCNIAMLIFEGSSEYLKNFGEPSSMAGQKLREIFDNLQSFKGNPKVTQESTSSTHSSNNGNSTDEENSNNNKKMKRNGNRGRKKNIKKEDHMKNNHGDKETFFPP